MREQGHKKSTFRGKCFCYQTYVRYLLRKYPFSVQAVLYRHPLEFTYVKGPGIVQEEFYRFGATFDQPAARFRVGVNLFHNISCYV